MEKRFFYIGVIILNDESEITIADSEIGTFQTKMECAIEEELPHIVGVQAYSANCESMASFGWSVNVNTFFR